MEMDKKYTPALWVCILMDLLGCASYAIPVFGEIGDLVWAPISAIIFYKMFGGTIGKFGSFFNFIEELFPGTDFIPTFTLSWMLKRVTEGRLVARKAA
jgi:hypothetical protein